MKKKNRPISSDFLAAIQQIEQHAQDYIKVAETFSALKMKLVSESFYVQSRVCMEAVQICLNASLGRRPIKFKLLELARKASQMTLKKARKNRLVKEKPLSRKEEAMRLLVESPKRKK